MNKRNEERKSQSRWLGIAVTLIGAILLLLFFLLLYPYHLRHREQTILFLSNWDWIYHSYFTTGKGGLVMLAGDWLQQLFYYIGAGPVILSILLTSLGVIWFHISKKLLNFIRKKCNAKSRLWVEIGAYTIAILVTIWETGRECLPEYPVASTLFVLLISLLLLIIKWPSKGIAKAIVFFALFFAWITSCPMPDQVVNAKAWGQPDMLLEHQMALDVEASLGNWQKVEQLTEDKYQDYNTEIYYRNLSLAQQGRLADSLLSRPQNGSYGLLIPVNENGNYFLFSAAGEAWWAIQDLTMAEHATLLGMIFSPRHTGSRNVRRLAEISLAKGDSLAADKYLRMLDQTIAHKQWAKNIRKKQFQITNTVQTGQDTLRLSSEMTLCLRSMLDIRPNNDVALQYLLCYDLLCKDMVSFAADVQQYGCPAGVRVFEEAILIILSSRPELREAWQSLIREQTYRDFIAFNDGYTKSQGQLKPLQQRFGKTYWYYFKAKLN